MDRWLSLLISLLDDLVPVALFIEADGSTCRVPSQHIVPDKVLLHAHVASSVDEALVPLLAPKLVEIYLLHFLHRREN